MIIKLRELTRAPGHTIRFDYTMDLSKEELNFEFPLKKPVRVVGAIEARLDAVHLDMEAQALVETHCARCNKPVAYEKNLPISFILTKDLDRSEMDDIIVIESDSVDLDEIVREEIIMNLESTVLCREDCLGLCPRCGKDLNEGPCGCERTEVDPRLRKLKDLLDQQMK